MVLESIRRCAHDLCNEPLRKKWGETPDKFRKREFCDKVCAARHKRDLNEEDPGEEERREIESRKLGAKFYSLYGPVRAIEEHTQTDF
jgi:hypothetical protein